MSRPKRCWYCGVQMVPVGLSPVRQTRDHIVPRANGGTDEWWNCVPCCRACNRRKGVLSLEEWRLVGPANGGKFWAEQHLPEQARRRFQEPVSLGLKEER